MSARRRSSAVAARRLHRSAPVFAALGDETRLSLLAELSGGAPRSIAQLTQRRTLTRQAVTKHLRVLEGAGLVRAVRRGRESLFELEPESLDEALRTPEAISQQWDQALAEMKSIVER